MFLFTWVVILEQDHLTHTNMADIFIPYNCQFIIVDSINTTSYRINEIYKIKEHTKLISKEIGTWVLDDGLTCVTGYFYERRMDLEGTEMLLFVSMVSIGNIVIVHVAIFCLPTKKIPFSVKLATNEQYVNRFWCLQNLCLTSSPFSAA